MRLPVQITFRDMDRSPALEAAIREKTDKLERVTPDLVACRVTVAQEARHQHQGREISVRLDITTRGKEFAFTRKHHEDAFVAARDAFDAARRVLQDELHQRRGDVKQHAPTQRGVVARVDERGGFGFIEADDGRELYFSRENVVHPDFDRLRIGTRVEFLEEAGAEGPQAKRVHA
ncbi:MAG: HPF/RaiA family ribosome-associated protein [Burkholderiaceae bacterium]|nr:HPF/RaiA family ribosome-associated protein [Burkholderiaceae bacterium]